MQILINFEYFETACTELEQLLVAARSSTSAGGPIVLNATEEFRSNKKTAEKRIFELVNSKIDDLVETAEYDWWVVYHRLYIPALTLEQDGSYARERTKQLHADPHTLPLQHHELHPPRAPPRDQRTNLLRRPLPHRREDPGTYPLLPPTPHRTRSSPPHH